MWIHQVLSGFLANGYLPRVLRQSRLPANAVCDKELKPGAEHIFPGITLQLRKTSENLK